MYVLFVTRCQGNLLQASNQSMNKTLFAQETSLMQGIFSWIDVSNKYIGLRQNKTTVWQNQDSVKLTEAKCGASTSSDDLLSVLYKSLSSVIQNSCSAATSIQF